MDDLQWVSVLARRLLSETQSGRLKTIDLSLISSCNGIWCFCDFVRHVRNKISSELNGLSYIVEELHANVSKINLVSIPIGRQESFKLSSPCTSNSVVLQSFLVYSTEYLNFTYESALKVRQSPKKESSRTIFYYKYEATFDFEVENKSSLPCTNL